MKRRKIFLIISMLVMTAIIFTACSTTTDSTSTEEVVEEVVEEDEETDATSESDVDSSSEKKIVHLNNTSEPGSLHPALGSGTHDSWAVDHMFVGLYEKTPEGVPGLAMAEEVTTSEDDLTWTFKLREDALWSNGDPVTAKDFAANWFFGLNPDNAAKYSSQLYIIQGAEAYNTGEGSKEDVAINIIDDYTISITLNNPVAYLPDLLTHYVFYPINADNAEANPDWYKSPDNYVSNGPFVLTEWKSKESIVLSKNENYYNKDLVNLDELDFIISDDKNTEWQLYENGDLDLVYTALPAVLDKLIAEESPELEITTDLATYYYLFNTEKQPFNNAKVRKALSMAIDRDIIVNNITKGGQTPAYSVTPIGVKTPDGEEFQSIIGDTFTENAEEAKVLLEEGLEEEGMSIDTFEFNLLYNTNDIHKKIAETIQNMWSENLGINVTLENAEFQVVLDRRTNGEFDVVRAGWVGDYSDPMTFLEMFTSYSPFNDGSWTNEEYDNLIKASFEEHDPEARIELLASAERIFMDDMGIMPIYFYSKQIITKPYLTGVFTPINKYPVLTYADIEK